MNTTDTQIELRGDFSIKRFTFASNEHAQGIHAEAQALLSDPDYAAAIKERVLAQMCLEGAVSEAFALRAHRAKMADAESAEAQRQAAIAHSQSMYSDADMKSLGGRLVFWRDVLRISTMRIVSMRPDFSNATEMSEAPRISGASSGSIGNWLQHHPAAVLAGQVECGGLCAIRITDPESWARLSTAYGIADTIGFRIWGSEVRIFAGPVPKEGDILPGVSVHVGFVPLECAAIKWITTPNQYGKSLAGTSTTTLPSLPHGLIELIRDVPIRHRGAIIQTMLK